MRQWFLAAFPALALLAGTAPAAAHDLTVAVTNVRNDRGVVHVDLCREAEFLKDCKISAEAKAMTGTTVVHVRGVPAGDYGIQATHDENDNKKVDRGLFGIPREGVGFSRDAPIGWGPPKWKDAVFSVAGDMSVTLKLRYFMGPRGPKG